MDLHLILLPTNLVNFAQIRQISRKFGQLCFFPYLFDLHPRLLHPRLFGSKATAVLQRCGGTEEAALQSEPENLSL